MRQAIKKVNEPIAWAVATKYAAAFEELATNSGLEGKIKQVVEIRTTLFSQAIRATRIEEAYDLFNRWDWAFGGSSPRRENLADEKFITICNRMSLHRPHCKRSARSRDS